MADDDPRVNEQITAETVRLIAADDQQRPPSAELTESHDLL